MPGDLKKYNALKLFLAEHDVFEIRNQKVYCNLCNKNFEYVPKEGVTPLKKHFKSAQHTQNSLRNVAKLNQKALNFPFVDKNVLNEFDKDLVDAFTAANIPITKIENEKFRRFLEKYTKIKQKANHTIENMQLRIYLKKISKLYLKNIVLNQFI